MSPTRPRAALAARPLAPVARRLALAAAFLILPHVATAQEAKKAAGRPAPKRGDARPRGPAPAATPAGSLKVLPGFQAELLYTVPRDEQGSWVSMTLDPKGRLIASDQYGKLFRVTPPPLGGEASATKVEPMAVAIGEAQGLLWAFDSLYVVVNSGGKFPSGLYRARDTDGDDLLDKVDLLRKLDGGGEHGPHAVLLAPDGKSLYVIAGNATRVPDLKGSLVPKVWGEDNLLPRLVDGNGFMADEKAPGGYVCRVDPDGKDWTLVSMGYRNPYDMAFHKDGDLFTYDSDMEWDMNTPWYRPTRVCAMLSGSDFGYRNGAGKWPAYYPDSLPPVVNVGPGSPTGVTFGYGSKFPAKYQDALYVCDWSYGKLYAAHLKARGAGYGADVEEFVTGSPLPLTDVLARPQDGALYFTIGGRRTTSGLYRISYTGGEPTGPSTVALPGGEARAERRTLEAFHGHVDPKAVAVAWPHLSRDDRYLRAAARIAIEFQPADTWRERALAEAEPQAALESLLALARVSAADPAHRPSDAPTPDPGLAPRIVESLGRLSWDALSPGQRLDLVRVHSVVFNRMGRPDSATSARLIAKFSPAYPGRARELNNDLLNLLVYLGDPRMASEGVAQLGTAPTQEEQLDVARALRVLKVGWTPALRRSYFEWLARAADYKGGASFRGFLAQIRRDAIATLSDAEKADLKGLLEPPVPGRTAASSPTATPRAFVKGWTVDELIPVVDSGMAHRDFDRGRALFAATQCFSCHRYDNEGGAAGPDLTGVSGRYGTRDLLESIVTPSKVISDQYAAVVVSTTDGKVVTGRVVNLNGDNMAINTNMLDPNAQVNVDRSKVDETRLSPVSMMPEGLLSTLDKDEILDLIAYLRSRGDRSADMFR